MCRIYLCCVAHCCTIAESNRYRKYHQLYEAMAAEWWMHYYNLIDLPVPTERGLYSLLEIHDPHQLYAKKEFEHCLNFNWYVWLQVCCALDYGVDYLKTFMFTQPT